MTVAEIGLDLSVFRQQHERDDQSHSQPLTKPQTERCGKRTTRPSGREGCEKRRIHDSTE